MKPPDPVEIWKFVAELAAQAVSIQQLLSPQSDILPGWRVNEFDMKVDAALDIDRTREFRVGAQTLNLGYRVLHDVRARSASRICITVTNRPVKNPVGVEA